MAIHPPKRISTSQGLGVNTTKSLRYLSPTVAVGTEFWNDLDTPWQEGDAIIARPGYTWVTFWQAGKPYIITKFLDEHGQLVGVYCDISRPVEVVEDGFVFEDLYLDVWQPVGGKPVILDADELDESVKAGYITPEEAARAAEVAGKLLKELQQAGEKVLAQF